MVFDTQVVSEFNAHCFSARTEQTLIGAKNFLLINPMERKAPDLSICPYDIVICFLVAQFSSGLVGTAGQN